MVKPPKTMQPEAVDLEKAGRASGRSFQDNSHHNYMARKIDMQRNQFGVQLPPPPLSPSSPPPSSPPKKKAPPPLSITSPSRSVRFTLETNHESSSSSSKKKKRIKKSSSSASMTAILERLQQRHGQGNKRLSRKRKRDRLSDAALSSKWFAAEDEEISFKSDEEEKESSMKMPPKDETGMHHVDNSPNTVPKSIVAQVPSAKEKILSAAKEDTSDDETDTAFPSSSSMMSSTLSPRKLRQSRPDLFFLGVVVKVNGYTDPCNETLKRMLQKHGGDLETYETQRVTHILAESLSKAKADIYKKMKKPIPVCTPAWIVDSIQAGKLLAHGDYLLDQLRNPEHNRIASFFSGSKQGPEESSKKAHEESWTKQGLSDPIPCQSASSKSTKRISPQPRAEKATDLDPFAIDSEECKPLIDTAVESTFTFLKQATGKTLSLNVTEAEETTAASSPPRAFKVYDGVGGDGDSVSEDERMEFPMFGQQSPISSADPDESSGMLAFPNVKVAVSVEKVVRQDNKDSDQQVGSEMDVTSKLLYEEAPAKQIERRGRGKSDDKYINGKIRSTGTDPNFLDSFFSNSRLSFIGSYKQRTKTTGSPRKAGMDPGSSSAGLKRFVFHVDMDCFFANVVLRNFPEHRDKPVVISHNGNRASDTTHNYGPEMPASKTSTSECATCNYKAREYGIKKGMYLGHARQLCPNVIVLYYDFEGYEEVSDQLQDILDSVAVGHHGCVEVVSCDEAYLELLLPDADTAEELAESIRAEIFEKTQCTASIGVGANKFLAKLGTDRVKPDGLYVVKEYRTLLESLKLRDLHGIGYRTEPKLAAEGLETVRDVWDLGDQGEGELCRILGPGLGKKVFMYCKGKDDRQVKPAERKSIGAECNYGVRFDGPYGVDYLIRGLAKEVQKRMETVGIKGRRVTLKVKQRKKGAAPAGKFLGHGSCHNLSKSLETPGSSPTSDANILSRISMTLFSELAVPLDDVRGMGIMLTKLNNDNALDVQTAPTNRITNWLKKDKPGPEPLDRTKAAGRASLDDSDHKAEDRLDDDPRQTGHSADSTFDKESKTNDSAFAADTDMSQVIDDDAAGLPLHFEKEIMSDAEESCQSVVDLIRASSHFQQFQHKQLSDNQDDHVSRSGINPSQFEKDFEPSNSDSSPSALTQLALPPLSQIHMSQVNALPRSLQKQILARIETAEHLDDFPHERSEIICIDNEDDNAMSSFDGAYPAAIQDIEGGLTEGPVSDIFCAARKSSQAKAKKAPRLSVEQSSARFRQSSLQRMMRLAAVKAGKETTDISLTQLDQLPLDIQLQIVNDDFRKNPPHPKDRSHAPSNRRSSIQSLSGDRDSMPSIRRGEPASEVTVKDKPPSSSFAHKIGEPFDMGAQKYSLVNTEADEPIEHDPRAFYLENVAPLKVFCDKNSSSACDTVEQVATFLKTCLTEGRSRDVVVLFRSLRNRADGWSNQEVLNGIARALDSEQMKVNGTRLDIDWLLGR